MAGLVKLDVEKLNRMIDALKGPAPIARVGILAKTNSRHGESDSNATVGACQEFGTSSIPKRSFLWMPLLKNFGAALLKSESFNEDTLHYIAQRKSLLDWVKTLGKTGEAVVLHSFKTAGDGTWAAHSPNTKSHTEALLIDTQQLYDSITSDVKVTGNK